MLLLVSDISVSMSIDRYMEHVACFEGSMRTPQMPDVPLRPLFAAIALMAGRRCVVRKKDT